MAPRTVDRSARRDQLVRAAGRVFAERGVSNTSVADIVREAGVAQGTFYLYFTGKDDVIVAVVESVADTLMTALAETAGRPGASAAQRIREFGRAFADLSQDRSLTDVAEFIHRPENQQLHDRFAEHLLPRLLPVLEGVIADGVADGSFRVPDTTAAAWFVLGGLRSIELAGTPLADLPTALAGATQLALRVLGSTEE